jgi:hypothetical protein
MALIWSDVMALEHVAPSPDTQTPSVAASDGLDLSSNTGQKITDISPSDSNSWFLLLAQQFLPAKLTDTFPTVPALSLSPSSAQYQLKVCAREAVADCFASGARPAKKDSANAVCSENL